MQPGVITKEGNLKAKGTCIIFKPAIGQVLKSRSRRWRRCTSPGAGAPCLPCFPARLTQPSLRRRCQGGCTATNTPKFKLDLETQRLHPLRMEFLCVTRHNSEVNLEPCSSDLEADQKWIMSEHL